MKKLLFLIPVFLFFTLPAIKASAATGKDPIVIEVLTNYTAADAALQAAKDALLKQKFIATSSIQKTGFTATRTTNARADYYVADVTVKEEKGKTKITISFVKVGTGLLKLQKVADAVKADLGK
ncbi:hypothetical protein A8C56_17285 [Niabella ginsenosidivorans]|uniref:DUF3568 family protein n=1 Tax=Niabella ginsenosidivorans TaxID=1176587 RepID=A0A1A9I609_9BACT|nr:hypothetical protein [Niabella ginsenosidivorans]ANH82489.1 hypothetical protein A8C56_17285 [Niabella ginsenosidivorans]